MQKQLTFTLTGNPDAPMKIEGSLGCITVRDFLFVVFKHSPEWEAEARGALSDLEQYEVGH